MAVKGALGYVQEPLFEEMKRDTCYVCGEKIKGDGVAIGHGLYRHEKCKPGSRRWARSPFGRQGPDGKQGQGSRDKGNGE